MLDNVYHVRYVHTYPVLSHLSSRSIVTISTQNALARAWYELVLLLRLLGAGMLPRAKAQPGKGWSLRSNPAQGRVRRRPEWPAHSRPLYFSRLSGATSTQQSFGTASPRFRHPTPSPRTEAAFAVEAVYYYHKGTQVIANTVRACAAVENRQSGACRLPDAGRTHPRMSPR